MEEVGRAITVEAGSKKVQLVARARPERVGAGQLVVRLLMRPVSPLESIIISDPASIPYILDPHHKSHITLGFEGMGVIDEVGEGVSQVKKGQRVIPIVWREGYDYGSWQDYVMISEKKVIVVPDNVSDEAASQFIGNPWTVYGLLETLAVPKGEYIVQTAAGSVLARQLIQFAKHQGVKTINIVRRDELKDKLKALGADEVINSSTEDVIQKVKDITRGKLAFGGLDAVGGDLTKVVSACIKDGGQVLVYGSLSGFDYYSQTLLDLKRKVHIHWWTLYEYVNNEEKEQFLAKEVMSLLESKIITPLAGKKFKLQDYKEAIHESKKEARGGKVLLIN